MKACAQEGGSGSRCEPAGQQPLPAPHQGPSSTGNPWAVLWKALPRPSVPAAETTKQTLVVVVTYQAVPPLSGQGLQGNEPRDRTRVSCGALVAMGPSS